MSDYQLAATSEAAQQALARLRQTYVLSDDEIWDLTLKVYQFCEVATGVKLYPYQEGFAKRIIYSLLSEDGEEITALYSRQSGKTETVAFVVIPCCVLLPRLATMPHLCEDSRITKFAKGLWVGIFAPQYEQVRTLASRMSANLRSVQMREVLADPDIDIDIPRGKHNLTIQNGSFIQSHSCAPGSNIESKTYHLLILDEAQDIDDIKVKKSVHPMGAATLATLVKTGTCTTHRSDFYEATERGRKRNRELPALGVANPERVQTHFESDGDNCAKYNARYALYIEKDKERLGFDSDEYRMSYRLHWILERGTYMAPEILEEAGIKQRDHLSKKIIRGGDKVTTSFDRSDYTSTSDRSTENQVAAIDVGRANSTIVTVAKVWWDNPQQFGDETRYYTHIQNWLELQGDDHEAQYPKIVDFLQNYRIGVVMVDSTGKGEPIYDRLHSFLEEYDIDTKAFLFSDRSKHDGYTMLYQEIREKRLTYPAGPGAQKLQKWQRFFKQMIELEKDWRGKYMVIQAPKSSSSKTERPHDDYPDSLMMLCNLVNQRYSSKIEVGDSPFMTRRAMADTLKRSRSWFRDTVVNRRQFPKGIGRR